MTRGDGEDFMFDVRVEEGPEERIIPLAAVGTPVECCRGLTVAQDELASRIGDGETDE